VFFAADLPLKFHPAAIRASAGFGADSLHGDRFDLRHIGVHVRPGDRAGAFGNARPQTFGFRQGRDFPRQIVRVEILRHAWLAKAVFAQKVRDAGRLFEAQDRKPQHQRVDRDVGKRIETGRKEQKIGALIRELDLARRAQNFHLRPESRRFIWSAR
jgi:hypothetical protein